MLKKGLIVLALLIVAQGSQSASLGVSPTMLDARKGEKVSGLRVRNSDKKVINVQARLMRWMQGEQGDVYVPAEGVVASPPATKIQPGKENLVRVVRTAKHPVIGEESYRLLVDELPDPAAQKEGQVSILIRHSVPVFFSNPKALEAQPHWRIEKARKEVPSAVAKGDVQTFKIEGWRIVVNNTGDRRLRLTGLELKDSDGKVVAKKDGLVGYVLGHSSAGFFVDKNEAGARINAKALSISVKTETEDIHTELLPVNAETEG